MQPNGCIHDYILHQLWLKINDHHKVELYKIFAID